MPPSDLYGASTHMHTHTHIGKKKISSRKQNLLYPLQSVLFLKINFIS